MIKMQKFTKTVCVLAFAFLTAFTSKAQLFVEKQTRHRFAQNLIGFDVQTSIGGNTFFLDTNGTVQKLDLGSTSRARIVLGGLHFWGHADFHIAIPVMFPFLESANQEIFFTSGVETAFKYYPWQLKDKKIRPYIGVSISPYYYEQDNNNFVNSEGPQLSHTSVPVMAGFTYLQKNTIIEAGINWNYANKQEYYLNRTDTRTISTPPLFASVALKFLFDTTISAEEGWESGETKKRVEQLGTEGKLSGIFVGAGLSSGWWLGQSSYNKSNRPYIGNYGISLMGDFTVGYYMHKPDLNVALNYRKYGASADVYGTKQFLKRKSIGLEVTKYFLDYHGFDPFIGPILTKESLSFKESLDGNRVHDISNESYNLGITFGWDIRPDRKQAIILRTSLRWFPKLDLEVPNDKSISFENLEFNFIQVVLFPNRLF